MVRDLKAKKAERKERLLQKLEKRTKQKEKKLSRKTKDGKDDGDEDEVENADLDAILADYKRQQEQFLKVTESPTEPPSPRSSATLVASPSNGNELFLFGGEHFNGGIASFFNDLYVYRINQDAWRKVTSPNSPLPRSGHAMCQGGNSGGLYLFGGEFSSPKQGTFYHYNDFWHLDPTTREWSKIETKGGPPARSGHRMTYFKNYIVLFGGFQDTSQQTKYLQDVWLYDTQRFVWCSPAFNAAVQKPLARSSFSMLPHYGGAVIFGGYSRVKAAEAVSRSARPTKAGPSSRVVMKPMVHQDSWLLRIIPAASDAPASTPPVVRWERRKRPMNTPEPPRAGATMTHHKGRGIFFGGVHDTEASEESIDSQFFNLLYAYNLDRNRFFQLNLRRPRALPKKAGLGMERGKRDRGRADVDDLMRNLAMIENKGSIDGGLDQSELQRLGVGDADDAEEEAKIEKLTMWEMPHPRFNAQLAVQEDTLYIFGGTFEQGDREYTFDEMWAIDLGKLDGMKEIFRRELEDWHGSDDEDEDDEDENDDEYEEEEEEEEEPGLDDDDTASTITSLSGRSSLTSSTLTGLSRAQTGFPGVTRSDTNMSFSGLSRAGTFDTAVGINRAATDMTGFSRAETIMDSESASALSDAFPHPRPFESLRDFFVRTSNEWQEAVLEAMKYERDVEDRSVKEIRKRAFDRAERKWWDCREEIQALEDEQEAAGISEVVSLADREQQSAFERRR